MGFLAEIASNMTKPLVEQPSQDAKPEAAKPTVGKGSATELAQNWSRIAQSSEQKAVKLVHNLEVYVRGPNPDPGVKRDYQEAAISAATLNMENQSIAKVVSAAVNDPSARDGAVGHAQYLVSHALDPKPNLSETTAKQAEADLAVAQEKFDQAAKALHRLHTSPHTDDDLKQTEAKYRDARANLITVAEDNKALWEKALQSALIKASEGNGTWEVKLCQEGYSGAVAIADTISGETSWAPRSI